MEERVKTSFIPKASLQVERGQPAPRGTPVALANVIAGVILILSIVGAGGMFLFEQFTIQNIASKQESLDRSREAFEPATIKELSRIDTRIKTGTLLLNEHLSVSKLFDELERLTLENVRFDSFSYQKGESGRGKLTAAGAATSFNSVALQSGGFSKSPIITEPIFSGVNIGEAGVIDFDFSAEINIDQILYAGGGVPTVPIETTTEAPLDTVVEDPTVIEGDSETTP